MRCGSQRATARSSRPRPCLRSRTIYHGTMMVLVLELVRGARQPTATCLGSSAVPCCGLGNRISLLLGAIAVAKNASLNLTVAWRTDPVLVRTAPKQQQSPASRTLLLALTCVLPRASECTLRRAVRAVVHRRRRQRQRPRFAVGRRQPKTLRSASCRGSAANDRAGEDQLPIRSAQA